MKTAHKILLAKVAYRAIKMARAVLGKGDIVEGRFDGLNYRLDLSQGIDFTIYLLGRFEPTTAAAIARHVKTDNVVLDIGANIGAHTLRLARLVGPTGRVLAFEPTNFAFEKLRVNLELNPDLRDRVQTFQCFLGRSESEFAPDEIYSSWPLTKTNNLHAKHLGAPMSTAGTPTRRLDDILAEQNVARVDFVKMDVDGFECDVLEGAVMMMRRDKPKFILEMTPYVLEERGESLDKLLSYFLPLGYQFYTEQGERPLPADGAAISRMIADGASINVLARAV